MDERRLARAGDTADDRERSQRHPQRHVLQVVLAGARQHEMAARRPPDDGHRDRLPAGEVACGQRARRLDEFALRTVEDDLAATLARAWSQLDDVIGRLDEAAVVLDDDDGVPGLGELVAEIGEAGRVARVQADRWLVEDVERAHELGAELVGQVDPLSLAARQRPGLSAQREIAEADPQQERELGVELLEDLASDR